MKHLKIFENRITPYDLWVVVAEWFTDADVQIEVFDNEESARDCLITMVNEQLETQFMRKQKEFTIADMITDYSKAQVWLIENAYDYKITIVPTRLRKDFKSNDLKLARDSKKYNL